MDATAIVAAGAVCWRRFDDDVHVLVVHRGDRADVSLPKGKVDPGETLPETAVREIAEETGLTVALGAPLGEVRYTMPNGRAKLVYYWSAEVTDEAMTASTFLANNEIAALEWIPIARAREVLTFSHDADIVESFADRVASGTESTFGLIVLRHAKAVPPETWDGPDATRPLLQRGTDQAASIALGIGAFRPTKILSSTAVRCRATVAPISRVTGIDVKETNAISQDAHEVGEAQVAKIIAKRLRKRVTAVLCSHGPVLPDIVEQIATQTNSPLTEAVRAGARLAPGEYAVLHLSVEHPDAGIVAIEIHSPTA